MEGSVLLSQVVLQSEIFRKQAKLPMSLVMSSELFSFKRISLKFINVGSY